MSVEMVVHGGNVAMTVHEVDALAGNGPVRLVTCANGRVIGGMGSVGLIEHVGITDLEGFIAEVKAKRAEIAERAKQPMPANPRSVLYEFTRI